MNSKGKKYDLRRRKTDARILFFRAQNGPLLNLPLELRSLKYIHLVIATAVDGIYKSTAGSRLIPFIGRPVSAESMNIKDGLVNPKWYGNHDELQRVTHSRDQRVLAR